MSDSAIRKFARTFANFLSWMVYLAGLLASFAALACWAFQWYEWLQKGNWLPLPLSKFVSFDRTGWVGLDQVTTLLLSINVGYPLLSGGVLLMILSLVII